MEIIGAGFGRCGTMSLKAALEVLGFPTMHMITMIQGQTSPEPWDRAARGQRVDWTEALLEFRASVDWPGCSYYKELMEDFPEAKVLLTVRDAESWYASCCDTIWPAAKMGREGKSSADADAHLNDEVADVIWRTIWAEGGTFGGRFDDKDHAIAVYEAHLADVKAHVPADRLLVHEIAEGWEPLCAFLDVPVPDSPFPRVNDKVAFREMLGMAPL